jgi:hypothetical protein
LQALLLEPMTRASPLVMPQASTLLAAEASMLGTYSKQMNSTSASASLKKSFWMATGQALQAGQSL